MIKIYNTLINKSISKLCYGTLTIGPLQRDFSPAYGASLMAEAFQQGINFFDTAEIYDNYEHFNQLLKMGIRRDEIIIATKSYSYDIDTAKKSLDMALEQIGTDYIDFFLLHEQESEHTFRGHFEATKYFLKMKELGKIRAFGISTHHIAALKAVLDVEYIDVVHPIVNKAGIGLVDGTMEEAIEYLKQIKQKGIFIYGMKPLGGGHLIQEYEESMDFVMNQSYLDSFAIGMQSKSEILANALYVEGKPIADEIKRSIKTIERKLLIHDWCIGCGLCVEKCQHKALEIVDSKAVVNQENCVFCGYCSQVCQEMCIKVI